MLTGWFLPPGPRIYMGRALERRHLCGGGPTGLRGAQRDRPPGRRGHTVQPGVPSGQAPPPRGTAPAFAAALHGPRDTRKREAASGRVTRAFIIRDGRRLSAGTTAPARADLRALRGSGDRRAVPAACSGVWDAPQGGLFWACPGRDRRRPGRAGAGPTLQGLRTLPGARTEDAALGQAQRARLSQSQDTPVALAHRLSNHAVSTSWAACWLPVPEAVVARCPPSWAGQSGSWAAGPAAPWPRCGLPSVTCVCPAGARTTWGLGRGVGCGDTTSAS